MGYAITKHVTKVLIRGTQSRDGPPTVAYQDAHTTEGTTSSSAVNCSKATSHTVPVNIWHVSSGLLLNVVVY